MIRVTGAETGDAVLLNPDHIIGVEYCYKNNRTEIIIPDDRFIPVRETVSEVDLLIKQYYRANKGG